MQSRDRHIHASICHSKRVYRRDGASTPSQATLVRVSMPLHPTHTEPTTHCRHVDFTRMCLQQQKETTRLYTLYILIFLVHFCFSALYITIDGFFFFMQCKGQLNTTIRYFCTRQIHGRFDPGCCSIRLRPGFS